CYAAFGFAFWYVRFCAAQLLSFWQALSSRSLFWRKPVSLRLVFSKGLTESAFAPTSTDIPDHKTYAHAQRKRAGRSPHSPEAPTRPGCSLPHYWGVGQHPPSAFAHRRQSPVSGV